MKYAPFLKELFFTFLYKKSIFNLRKTLYECKVRLNIGDIVVIGNDFETPIMYQDLANYSMGPMVAPFGWMTNPYSTNMLHGTAMPRQLDADKVEIMKQKENQDKSTFKKAAIALGVILAAGFIPFVRKGIKNGNLWQSVKDLFKSGPKQPIMPRIKKWFGARKENVKNLYGKSRDCFNNNMPKVKNWFSDKWDGLKKLFKFKK